MVRTRRLVRPRAGRAAPAVAGGTGGGPVARRPQRGAGERTRPRRRGAALPRRRGDPRRQRRCPRASPPSRRPTPATSSAATRPGSATAGRCCSARSSTPTAHVVDLHLKGSGRTPFARGGDGRAALGPMLREYVIGEAMHALGIPTTRALAVVATGETILREVDGRVTDVPGAVLARVAASHLRVGTFQYAAATGDRDCSRRLADYAIARHAPDAAERRRPGARAVRARRRARRRRSSRSGCWSGSSTA